MKTLRLILKIWLCVATAQLPLAFAQITSTQQQQLGDKNYLVNSGFENGKAKWVTYKDSAAAMPVDGLGGTPAVTITSSTSLPLADKASGVLTKGAVNLQGEGFAQSFTIDSLAKGKVLTISGTYQIVSGTYSGGTSSTDSDVELYIYDVDAGQIIQPAGYKLNGGVAGINYDISATFQTNTTSSNYRLIFHVATNSASNYVLKFDNLSVSLKRAVIGAPLTEWQSYTPTFTGFGTVTTQSFQWRRVGSNAEIRGRFTVGTPTATEARISLPPGLTSTSTIATLEKVGSADRSGGFASGYFYPTVLIEPSVSYLTFGVQESVNPALLKRVANAVFTASESVSFVASVPIAGWSSSLQISSDSGDSRVVAAKYTTSATSAVANVVTKLTYGTKVIDTHAGMSGDTYTVSVPGIYRVSGMIHLASNSWSNGALELRLYKNGSFDSQIAYFTQATGSLASSTMSAYGSTIIQANAGDTLTFYAIQSQTASIALSGSPQTNFITIERISGMSQIAASENVAMRYTNTAGTTSTTSYTVVPFANKDYDTHSMYNTATGVATVPLAGKFLVCAQTNITQGGQPVLSMAIYKNGSLYNEWSSQYSGSTTPISISFCDTLNLVAGETISVYHKNSIGSVNISTTAGRNYLNIVRVGN